MFLRWLPHLFSLWFSQPPSDGQIVTPKVQKGVNDLPLIAEEQQEWEQLTLPQVSLFQGLY